MSQSINIVIAFVAGLLAFFSPCFLPLVPAYLIYITGLSFEDLDNVRSKTILHSISFILGFSIVFVFLGITASLFTTWLDAYRDILRILGGGLIVVLGLYLLGVIRFQFLDIERKVSLATKPAGYFGSFLVGIVFALGWSPCIGPILGGILILASQTETVGQGVLMLSAFCLGLGMPLFLFSLAVNYSLSLLKKIQQYLGIIHRVCGFFLVMVGLLLISNFFQTMVTWLIRLTGYKGS
ncbi:hypothetical protein A2291_06490 [candidate division WOR-1 bacterium RIFOXYB2_FULL_42_35]|uniref:Cytochrome C biogenesis protein transmembrane domain-containing protein n=1 Tax=candidate division WOR-1 bacterium RIFOXYC2_FULL_41_25 TaxID=1802586 RepID=A0A1F4TPE3_UNCSA|nr:MAG: hypothetical protein A2291_06490 [candidate division WOR-1 bacterium RIFOXYB2_FULL_42_35]OGC24530.1 MAG: hypothetical protein A2247_06270 [candidate division WOR-1 bacterium RIFOXYA2_FULL_41_14]OGC34575.1 MAG: hypothetical protein A2462_04505 [candidate division WOR-1 bacterium RIFOXYC2_FULL_41_25]OGC43729.1 MAG: hypothetical protein A2548_05900 [candidate division WOR-1 bacterium RIFOXYD2_FULL_41_8]